MEELLNKIESYAFQCEGGPLTLCQDWMKLRMRLLLADAPAVAEPVAWRNEGVIRFVYTESKWIAEQWALDGVKVEPLYAALSLSAAPLVARDQEIGE